MAGALKRLANVQPSHRVAMQTILAHLPRYIHAQSSKVSWFEQHHVSYPSCAPTVALAAAPRYMLVGHVLAQNRVHMFG